MNKILEALNKVLPKEMIIGLEPTEGMPDTAKPEMYQKGFGSRHGLLATTLNIGDESSPILRKFVLPDLEAVRDTLESNGVYHSSAAVPESYPKANIQNRLNAAKDFGR